MDEYGNKFGQHVMNYILHKIIGTRRSKMLEKFITFPLCSADESTLAEIDLSEGEDALELAKILYMDGRVKMNPDIILAAVENNDWEFIVTLNYNEVDLSKENNINIQRAWDLEHYETVAILLSTKEVLTTLDILLIKKYRAELKKLLMERYYDHMLNLVLTNASVLEMCDVMWNLTPLAKGISMHTLWNILSTIKNALNAKKIYN